MTDRVTLPPKISSETETISFDFISRLSSGETISTRVVTSTVWSGVDASPASMISGAATSDGANPSVVHQLVTGGLPGVTYYLLCTITTSTGQTLQLAAFLVILPSPTF